MNDQKVTEGDTLRQYIDPHNIEKVPEGFTANVMTRISLEARHNPSAQRLKSGLRVPLIASGIALVLAIVALSLHEPAGSVLPSLDFLNVLNIPALPIPKDLFASIRIPGIVLYLAAGLMLLVFFDRALFSLFRNDTRKPKSKKA